MSYKPVKKTQKKSETTQINSSDLNKELRIRFLAIKNADVCSPAYQQLKKQFFNLLWQEKDYEQLERILKSIKKEEFSAIMLENLSKLAFLRVRADKKKHSNPFAFVSYILTGGACLVLRNAIYHADVAEVMQALANELKTIFSKTKEKNPYFECFIDYESSVLIQVLLLGLEKGEFGLEIIPSPTYLKYYDAAKNSLSRPFLSWLAVEDAGLCQLYQQEINSVVSWLCGAEPLPVLTGRIDPYLRLAFMFRAGTLQKALPKISVELSDFEGSSQTVFKPFLIHILQMMLNQKSIPAFTATFWEMLQKFYPVLQDTELKKAIIQKALIELNIQYRELCNLNVESVKALAIQISAGELEKELEVVVLRKRQCVDFLLSLKQSKKTASIIRALQDETMLREHLTLISDTCVLLYESLSLAFFRHIHALVKSAKIKKWIALKKQLRCQFDCTCPVCLECLYREDIPELSRVLKLPVIQLPDEKKYDIQTSLSTVNTLKPPVFSQINPFELLGVALTDTKAVIMKKVMQHIQQLPEKMAIFRQAQSELFDPGRRFLHDYLRYWAHENEVKELIDVS